MIRLPTLQRILRRNTNDDTLIAVSRGWLREVEAEIREARDAKRRLTVSIAMQP